MDLGGLEIIFVGNWRTPGELFHIVPGVGAIFSGVFYFLTFLEVYPYFQVPLGGPSHFHVEKGSLHIFLILTLSYF